MPPPRSPPRGNSLRRLSSSSSSPFRARLAPNGPLRPSTSTAARSLVETILHLFILWSRAAVAQFYREDRQYGEQHVDIVYARWASVKFEGFARTTAATTTTATLSCILEHALNLQRRIRAFDTRDIIPPSYSATGLRNTISDRLRRCTIRVGTPGCLGMGPLRDPAVSLNLLAACTTHRRSTTHGRRRTKIHIIAGRTLTDGLQPRPNITQSARGCVQVTTTLIGQSGKDSTRRTSAKGNGATARCLREMLDDHILATRSTPSRPSRIWSPIPTPVIRAIPETPETPESEIPEILGIPVTETPGTPGTRETLEIPAIETLEINGMCETRGTEILETEIRGTSEMPATHGIHETHEILETLEIHATPITGNASLPTTLRGLHTTHPDTIPQTPRLPADFCRTPIRTPYGPPNPSSGSFESQRSRSNEDPPGQHMLNRNHLAIQEMNRTKGRVSPLPQAVQGAQPQLHGPAGEPGIKSEFGRVFSGLGGIGGLGVSSPVTSAPPSLPFSNSMSRRDDADAGAHDSPADGAKMMREGSRGRRRKLKEEDPREDDSSGRQTPGGKAKRPKTLPHHHHHQYTPDGTAPQPVGPPFKAGKGNTPIQSPTLPKDGAMLHPHGPRPTASTSKPAPSPVPVLPPKPKQIINSKAVLDSVADRPRHHLGDTLYEPIFTPSRLVPNVPSHRGFSTTPKPLPFDRIRDQENCTITVKVARIHLTPSAREEVTARRAVWGTEVYTDDSDVIAACIHGGWIRGEWPEDVDVNMLDLDRGIFNDGHTGPVHVPADRDMHVTLLILPKLQKYGSTTRFGIQSRQFGSSSRSDDGQRAVEHDGLSFMILGVRWVENGAGAQSRLRGQARRDRMRKAMREVRTTFNGVNGAADLENGKEVIRKLRSQLENGVLIPPADAVASERLVRKSATAKMETGDKSTDAALNGEAGDEEMAEVEKTEGERSADAVEA
ncbi:unnamed protein product [Parascedosporium putredinis]|uniref:Rxt3-domain-containing protein n=1 Tax=Parascedosporium putredinis TaxID=1442378 RepID=A0A9P1M7U4_9PEZI|nr:unnamed protein product [Parascedosporium putredinis]CAI7988904.1 unnamed protein product [Parascedosporium putredinis]